MTAPDPLTLPAGPGVRLRLDEPSPDPGDEQLLADSQEALRDAWAEAEPVLAPYADRKAAS